MKNSEFQPAEEKREPKSLFCEPQKDRPSGKYAEKDLKREQKDCRQIHQPIDTQEELSAAHALLDLRYSAPAPQAGLTVLVIDPGSQPQSTIQRHTRTCPAQTEQIPLASDYNSCTFQPTSEQLSGTQQSAVVIHGQCHSMRCLEEEDVSRDETAATTSINKRKRGLQEVSKTVDNSEKADAITWERGCKKITADRKKWVCW